MVVRTGLIGILTLMSLSAYAGPGIDCQDAARAAGRQEAIHMAQQSGEKVTIDQANFSAELMNVISEGVQGTFTDKIGVSYWTPETRNSFIAVEVEGQLVGTRCNILRVMPNRH